MKRNKMNPLILFVSLANIAMGVYLIGDAFYRLREGMSTLIFDQYIFGLAKYIPLVLGVSMILAGILILNTSVVNMLLFSFINSFFFLLFYTPSVFYSGIRERYSPWLLVIQIALAILAIVILFSVRMPSTERALEKLREGTNYMMSLQRVESLKARKETGESSFQEESPPEDEKNNLS